MAKPEPEHGNHCGVPKKPIRFRRVTHLKDQAPTRESDQFQWLPLERLARLSALAHKLTVVDSAREWVGTAEKAPMDSLGFYIRAGLPILLVTVLNKRLDCVCQPIFFPRNLSTQSISSKNYFSDNLNFAAAPSQG